jgi:hypothetical protein
VGVDEGAVGADALVLDCEGLGIAKVGRSFV